MKTIKRISMTFTIFLLAALFGCGVGASSDDLNTISTINTSDTGSLVGKTIYWATSVPKSKPGTSDSGTITFSPASATANGGNLTYTRNSDGASVTSVYTSNQGIITFAGFDGSPVSVSTLLTAFNETYSTVTSTDSITDVRWYMTAKEANAYAESTEVTLASNELAADGFTAADAETANFTVVGNSSARIGKVSDAIKISETEFAVRYAVSDNLNTIVKPDLLNGWTLTNGAMVPSTDGNLYLKIGVNAADGYFVVKDFITNNFSEVQRWYYGPNADANAVAYQATLLSINGFLSTQLVDMSGATTYSFKFGTRQLVCKSDNRFSLFDSSDNSTEFGTWNINSNRDLVLSYYNSSDTTIFRLEANQTITTGVPFTVAITNGTSISNGIQLIRVATPKF